MAIIGGNNTWNVDWKHHSVIHKNLLGTFIRGIKLLIHRCIIYRNVTLIHICFYFEIVFFGVFFLLK